MIHNIKENVLQHVQDHHYHYFLMYYLDSVFRLKIVQLIPMPITQLKDVRLIVKILSISMLILSVRSVLLSVKWVGMGSIGRLTSLVMGFVFRDVLLIDGLII